MKLKIEHLIILGLFVYILFLSMCNSPKVGKQVVIERHTDTIVEHDTVINEVVRSHVKLQPVNIHDTVILTVDQIADLDTFKFEIRDSLMDANITAFCESQPLIDFDYKIKHFEIKEVVTIKDSLITEEKKNEFYFGAMIGGSQSTFVFAPKVDLKTKKGFIYTGGFDVINKNILLGVSKKISF